MGIVPSRAKSSFNMGAAKRNHGRQRKGPKAVLASPGGDVAAPIAESGADTEITIPHDSAPARPVAHAVKLLRGPPVPLSSNFGFSMLLADESEDEEMECLPGKSMSHPSTSSTAAPAVQVIPNVNLKSGASQSDPATWWGLQAARTLSQEIFLEDCLETCRRSGYQITLLASNLQGGPDVALHGFVVFKLEEKEHCVSIAKLAVPVKDRKRGYGRKLIQWAVEFAKQQPQVRRFSLVSLATSVGFYEHLGFRRVRKATAEDVQDDIFFPGQIYMDKAV